MSYNSSNSFILLDVVVFKPNYCDIQITSIKYLIKKDIDVSKLPKKTFGNKLKDNKIFCNLSRGILNFEDVQNLK